VIVGAASNGKMIATIDWTTMEYQVQPVSFNNDRFFGSCALLKNKNGDILVAAAGRNKYISLIKKIF
jgi:hypothetical protein